MRKEYHCLALDQRGHGESDWSPQLDYSVEVQRSDIETFVDLLHLERFILVGMSMGGVNAIAYAVRHSRRLAGLVLVNVGPDINLGGVERIKQFMLRQAPNGKWRWKCDLRRWLHTDIRQSVAKLRELWTDVRQIRCPTLVVRGALSDILLDEDAERLASALPDGRWARVDGAGHIVQGDNPRKLVETLRAFFRDINV